MSKVDLAAVSGMSANSLSSYEKAKTTPKEETVERLAAATEFPVGFFYGPEASLVDPRAVSFRGLARMPASERDRVLGAVGLAAELDTWIDERFSRPVPCLPDLSSLGPVAAADAIRSEWGLGHAPIPSLISVAERAGVRVYSLGSPEEGHRLSAIDALSTWWDSAPFVFLNTMATVERLRHSLAHELGHLILHRDGGPSGPKAEKEANQFAGNLLLPRDGLKAEAGRFSTFDAIVQAKGRWKVSALAYVYRMNEEKILDEWRYRELCIRIRREYGEREPSPSSDAETSQVLRKVFSRVRQDGGRLGVAADLRIPVADLDALIFRHTLTPLPGDGGREDVRTHRPPLKVVK